MFYETDTAWMVRWLNVLLLSLKLLRSVSYKKVIELSLIVTDVSKQAWARLLNELKQGSMIWSTSITKIQYWV
jgi:hypothetical protein